MASEQQELLWLLMRVMVFICKFEDLIARNKAGKALISLSENAKVLKLRHFPSRPHFLCPSLQRVEC